MESRRKELEDLKSYITTIDKELTMVLQSLQWDRKHLIEGPDMETCLHNHHHKVPADKKEEHEKVCLLTSQGYCKDYVMPPSPIDSDDSTVVKFNADQIRDIIKNAATKDPLFKTAQDAGDGRLPLVSERQLLSSDERRVLYDAVVAAAPPAAGLLDLTLPSGSHSTGGRDKSRLEVLAEQRDRKRRRARYRVAGGAGRYSDTLRELISVQMELLREVRAGEIKKENISDSENTSTYTINGITQPSDKPIAKNERFCQREVRSHDRHHNHTHRERYKRDKYSHETNTPDYREGSAAKSDKEFLRNVRSDGREHKNSKYISEARHEQSHGYNKLNDYDATRRINYKKNTNERCSYNTSRSYKDGYRNAESDTFNKFNNNSIDRLNRGNYSDKDEKEYNKSYQRNEVSSRRYETEDTNRERQDTRLRSDADRRDRRPKDSNNFKYEDKPIKKEPYKRYYDVNQDDHDTEHYDKDVKKKKHKHKYS